MASAAHPPPPPPRRISYGSRPDHPPPVWVAVPGMSRSRPSDEEISRMQGERAAQALSSHTNYGRAYVDAVRELASWIDGNADAMLWNAYGAAWKAGHF